jgi:hypothetical protein
MSGRAWRRDSAQWQVNFDIFSEHPRRDLISKRE